MDHFAVGQAFPTMEELEKHVIPLVATKWSDLGLVLFKYVWWLNDLKTSYKQDLQYYCTKMFNRWLDTDTTWYQLIEATRSINLYDVADNIESLLQREYTV